MSGTLNKDELCAKMSSNLMVLRNVLKLTQSELAGKMGVSRQTLLDIEKLKRSMSWNTFLALLSIFHENVETSNLLNHFGIYTAELGKYLTSPDDVRTD